MLLHLHPENPSERNIKIIVECLLDGGVIIYPTDTMYGIGCNIFKTKSIERVARIKGIKADKKRFSFICSDLSELSKYTKPIENNVYKMMKRAFPGPYTFILEANNNVPKIMQSKKKTVGIRIPDHNIPREIVRHLQSPIISTSLPLDEYVEYNTDPELMEEKYGNLVDIVVDGGYCENEVSTVIDCTSHEIELVREGKGDFNSLF